MGAHLGSQTKGISKQNYHENQFKPSIYIYDCVLYIYTPTGKREDLWETHVKRPKVFKCQGAYMSISLMLYFNLSRVLTSGRD